MGTREWDTKRWERGQGGQWKLIGSPAGRLINTGRETAIGKAKGSDIRRGGKGGTGKMSSGEREVRAAGEGLAGGDNKKKILGGNLMEQVKVEVQ